MESQIVTIVPINIRDHYVIIDGMMRDLHVSEKELFNMTDDWDVIGSNYMKHLMESQEECEGTFLMAYVNEDPAGFTFGYIEEEGEERIEAYEGKDLYVSDGYIKPEYRRLGLYRQLNDELERIYITKGVRRMLRFTLTSNTRMQRFLEREGYTAVRLLYEKWLAPDGKAIIPLDLKPPTN